jgi:hypothetical protein
MEFPCSCACLWPPWCGGICIHTRDPCGVVICVADSCNLLLVLPVMCTLRNCASTCSGWAAACNVSDCYPKIIAAKQFI